MKAIYVCEFCGFQSEHVGEVTQDEHRHLRPNELSVVAAASWPTGLGLPGNLLVDDKSGVTGLYVLDHRVTAAEVEASATPWVWRSGSSTGKIK